MAAQDLVIVSGNSGFIGSALVERLAGRHALAGSDRIAKDVPPPAAECICIVSPPNLRSRRRSHARGSPAGGASHRLSTSPVRRGRSGTCRNTRSASSASRAACWCTPPSNLIREDTSLDPRWPYPMSKVQTEALIR